MNGEKVIKVANDAISPYLMYGYWNKDNQKAFYIYQEGIKSVVTKEQFSSLEYKI